VVILFIIVFVLSVNSCSPQNRVEGYVYYRLNANPTTLDPARIVDVPGGLIAAKLFNGLVKIDKNLDIRPDIAERWSISNDGLVYTFTLKKGIFFSNNREVNAHDVYYSFSRILNPSTRSPFTWVFDKIDGATEYLKGDSTEIEGLRVIDKYTLQIRLRKPFSPFLNLLAMTAAYVIPYEEIEKWGQNFSSHPVGTGPYTLKEWLPNRELTLEKREGYFDRPAKVRGIIYRIVPEDLTAVTEFEIGNIDVLAIPASVYSKYRNDTGRQKLISSLKGLNTYYIGMNCARPPFDNPNIRKAMNHAIDREKILHTIYEKRGRLSAGPLPDIMRKWDAPTSYEYNPQKAIELLKNEEVGSIIDFYVTADQEVIDIAEVIQAYLIKIGIEVRIKQLEWSSYKEAINKAEPEMFYLSWWADYPDPENFLFPLFHSSNHGPAGNRTRYTNIQVDSLIEKGQHTLDEEKRNLYYKQAEQIIADDAPWVFLWHRTDFTIRQPWIKDYTVYPIYSMDKGTDVSL
jgi:peptide/nickel transport system substrate-binding protein/oligopeptide transport system substrate-binding protein